MNTLSKLLICAAVMSTSAIAHGQYLMGTPLTEPGEGEVKEYSRDCYSYFTLGGLMTSIDADYGGAVQMVVSPDNDKVWFNYALANFSLPNWVEGKLDGNTITVALPQAIYVEEGSTYFLAMLSPDEDDLYNMANTQTLTLKQEDGVWTSEGCDEQCMLGLVSSEGGFMGAGAYNLSFTPFDDEWQEAPSGIETERYAFVNLGTGLFINIGFDGDDCWIQGMLGSNPDSWIRGSRKGNEITFPTAQYLGVWESEENTPHHCYFMAAKPLTTRYSPIDNITFTYNEADKSYSTDMSIIYNFNNKGGQWCYINAADKPVFTYQPATEIKVPPTNPSQVMSNMESASAYIPQTAVDGTLLDADNLYYRLYLDGELYTFTKDNYKFLDVEEMTDVPYNYTEGYDFFIFDANREVYIYETDYAVVGFQTVYKDNDKELVSDIVNSDGSIIEVASGAGIEELQVNGTDRVEYYNLMGHRVSATEKGVVIKRTIRANGTVKTEKLMQR